MAETGLITTDHTYTGVILSPVTALIFSQQTESCRVAEFSMLSCYVGAMDLRLEEAGADAAGRGGG